MLIAQHTIETTATVDAIWALWADVTTWKEWDEGLQSCELDGPFVAGSRGVIHPQGGPRIKYVLTRVEPGRGFADRSYLPLARLDFEHAIEELGDGRRRVTHRAVLKGPLGFLFKRVLGPKIAAGLPQAVTALARRAEAAS